MSPSKKKEKVMQKTIFALSFPYSSLEKDGKDHAEKTIYANGASLARSVAERMSRQPATQKSVRKADGRASAGIRSQKRHAAW
jgi:hypothetical protein